MLLKIILGFMVLYVPYELHFQKYFPLDVGFKGLNLFNLVFLLAWVVMVIAGIKAKTPAPLRTRFLLFFAAICIAYFLGQGYDSSTTLDDLTVLKNAILYMLLYFLFYHAVQDVKTIRLFFALILGVALLASLEMVREAIGYGIGSYNVSHRVAGPFGPYDYKASNLASAYLVMFIPVFASVFMFYKSKPLYRWIAFGSAIVCVMAVFFTGSRQAYLILVLVFVLLAFRRGILTAVLLTAFLVMGYEYFVPQSAIQRIQMTETVDEMGNKTVDESTESRLVQWSGALELVKDRPWGIGLNHFKREIGTFSVYSRLDAHNFYVLILTEAGIQGLAALLLVLMGLYGLARRLQRIDSSEETQLLGYGYMMAVVCMMLGNVYGSRFFDAQVMGNFWMLSGIVARYYTLALETADEGTEARAGSLSGGRNRFSHLKRETYV